MSQMHGGDRKGIQLAKSNAYYQYRIPKLATALIGCIQPEQ